MINEEEESYNFINTLFDSLLSDINNAVNTTDSKDSKVYAFYCNDPVSQL